MANKALCIGINNYPGTHMDLQGCVNDAEDWASVLSARAYKTTTLLDDKATKAAMVDAMSKLIGSAAKGDSLIITFSGHGTYQPDENGDEADGLDEALCPYDLQTGGNALTDDEIRALFATRKGGVRLLLISDSCHSGTVTRAAKAEKDADTRPRFMPMGNWLPASKMPKNFAGKPALTMLAPAAVHRCWGPLADSWATSCWPAARKGRTTTATTQRSTVATTGPLPITPSRRSRPSSPRPPTPTGTRPYSNTFHRPAIRRPRNWSAPPQHARARH
jgi:hypothetical protein